MSFQSSVVPDSLDVGAVQELANFADESNLMQDYPNSNASQIPVNPQLLRRFIPTNHPLQYQAQLPSTHQGTSLLPLLPDIMEPELHLLGIRIQHLNMHTKNSIITTPNGCCIYYGRIDEVSRSS